MFTKPKSKPKQKKEVSKQEKNVDQSSKVFPDITARAILDTDDYKFNKDYKKDNRRVFVLNVTKTGEMIVSKIHSLDDKEDKVEQGKLCPLEDKYKCLPKKSGVSVYPIRKDRDGKPLRTDDKEFKNTKEKITPRDSNRVRRAREKYFGKNNKKKRK